MVVATKEGMLGDKTNGAGVKDGCPICLTQSPKERVIYEDSLWRLRHSGESNILGYLILEPKRHFLDLSEATDTECATMGPLLRKILKAMKQVIDCERIYTCTLAELVPHYHVHIIPRTEATPKSFRGRGMLSYPTKPSCNEVLMLDMCDRIRRALRRVGE